MIRWRKEMRRLKVENHNLKVQNSVFEKMIESYRQEDMEAMEIISSLKMKNIALQDALKIATAEPEVEIWKTALDEDIEQYILKEE